MSYSEKVQHVQTDTEATKPIPAKDMHKIVFAMLGVFLLAAITYPIAMFRVSGMEKFLGFHVKSWDTANQLTPSEAKLATTASTSPATQPATQPVAPGTASVSSSPLASDVKTLPSSDTSTPTSSGVESATSTETSALPKDTAAISETTVPEIDVAQIRKTLYSKVDQAWTEMNTPVTADSVYQVQVTSDGAIAQVEPQSEIAKDNLNNTPLSGLVEVDNSISANETTELNMKFTADGFLDI
ncbi:MAG: hypothetical protein ACRC8A_12375 [Microcoleaceae cyanobacterium]